MTLRNFRGINEIIQIRRNALLSGNADALSEILTDDYLHIHASGLRENRKEFIDSVRTRIRWHGIVSDSAEVIASGDAAVVIEDIAQEISFTGSLERKSLKLITTQIYRRDQGKWLLWFFQSSYKK